MITPRPWVASQYLDTHEWGILADDNTIVVGVSARLTKAHAEAIVKAVNAYFQPIEGKEP